MKGLKKKGIWGVVIAALLVIAFVSVHYIGHDGTKTAEANSAVVNKGPMAPQFKLKDMNGKTVSLSDFKGQKVYVKFWASWCPICLAGLDDLNKLSGEKHDYKVLTIVSPGYNGEQSEKDFVDWFSKRGYNNIEVLLDDGGTWAKKFGVKGYPSSYYIGTDGVLAKAIPGHNTNKVVNSTIQTIN
ncbi:hypothetical protein GCM10011391_07080 [Pullulanibacillus camelliae]|uniref:Thioredoxin domain-containing protein n=1 Tax=Pullulanibacillus camelliae TaxID=1707096 RepID=A0A8J2YCK6_9BACL|nr:redoxin domain-containing protein [Pullulanibacillus camelliae]GGE30993.1 hypothetical protein GCM10011391_07080 [Pullulanibacillus camelliae]